MSEHGESKIDKKDFRETLYTIDKRGNRRWVYNSIVRGKFFALRSIAMTALLAFYMSMPWISIAGEQAILFNIPERRFVIFGSVFWATDTTFLFLVLIILAISLFFFTAIVGRVWCGWACPETVFLDFLFRPVERLIEGSPAERLRLDQSPWTVRKIRIKGTKFLVFAVLAWFVASTFLAYFLGREPLIAMMSAPPTHNWEPFLLTLAMMGVMLFQFGWFREQFCTVVCPYARFQSVMMDANSLTVGYDTKRGEPRGNNRKGAERQQFGDCIDCGLCVRVCPTGIDIRNGLQLECVACAACIDACDSVMLKLGRAPGLVRYDTENGLAGQKTTFFRPRLFVYGAILTVLLGTLAYRLAHRSSLDVQLVRGALDAPFTRAQDGRIVNHLHLHLSNKTKLPLSVTLRSADPDLGLSVIMPLDPFPIAPEATAVAPVFIEFPIDLLDDGRRAVGIVVRGSDGTERLERITLLGPEHEEYGRRKHDEHEDGGAE
jgi:cytochrome c oxidase accessory protein FixG